MFIPQASSSAAKVDLAFYRMLGMELVLLVIVTAAMVFFVVKYRRKEKPVPENIEGSTFLEIVWTIIPTLLVLVMFYIGWVGFDSIRTVPKEVMTIRVTARQWSWLFSYDNGKQSSDLRVPVGKPVKLLLTSLDVTHSFYIPAFRIKEDCVPNMETYLSFTADEIGTYDIFCTEYCGLGHSSMLSKVVAMSDRDFDSWYAAVPAAAKKAGGRLLEEKGCLGCHTTDGTAKIGPTFKGLYGSSVIVLTNGKERTVTANEDYLQKSVREPKTDVVKGFPDIMPPTQLRPEELDAIVEYIETLK